MQEINSRQITISEMAPHVHTYTHNENKTEKILLWLKDWIAKSLENEIIKPFDLLPSKAELSYHIGVSKGTIQNVFRQLENMGYVDSKQKIGTYIKPKDNKIKTVKLTSKRDVAVENIKQYILENKYKTDEYIPSIRKLSVITGISNATTRQAVMQLILEGVLVLRDRKYLIANINFENKLLEQETLVSKTAGQIQNYIHTELKPGDKIPPTDKLAQMYNVSIKTIHDSVKILKKQGLLYSRRGKYGTVVLDLTEKNIVQTKYCYEKIELKIREYISGNCKTGDKLPTISKMAKEYKTSERTVKNAVDNLVQEGYLTSVRGRYGGIYVLEDLKGHKDTYKWLAINSEYIPEME